MRSVSGCSLPGLYQTRCRGAVNDNISAVATTRGVLASPEPAVRAPRKRTVDPVRRRYIANALLVLRHPVLAMGNGGGASGRTAAIGLLRRNIALGPSVRGNSKSVQGHRVCNIRAAAGGFPIRER